MNFGNFLHVYICMEIFFQRRSTQSKSGHDHGALLKLKIKLHVLYKNPITFIFVADKIANRRVTFAIYRVTFAKKRI